jgi:hypothetical protein
MISRCYTIDLVIVNEMQFIPGGGSNEPWSDFEPTLKPGFDGVCNYATGRPAKFRSTPRAARRPMALPTHGRVLLDTTAGDIDIELWSKVRVREVALVLGRAMNVMLPVGSAESMQEFYCVGYGGCASLSLS